MAKDDELNLLFEVKGQPRDTNYYENLLKKTKTIKKILNHLLAKSLSYKKKNAKLKRVKNIEIQWYRQKYKGYPVTKANMMTS